MERPAGKTLSGQDLRAFAPSASEQAQSVSVALILKIPHVSAAKKASGGSAAAKRAKLPAAANSFSAPGRQDMEFSKSAPKEELSQLESESQSDSLERVISKVARLVRLANGKILREPSTAEGKTGQMLTEIPAENYPGFLDQLRGLGETELKGVESKQFIPRPKSRVIVSVTFETSR